MDRRAAPSGRWAARTRWVLGGVLAAAALWLLACWLLPSGSDNSLVGHSHDKEVLVMYIFAATDPEFLGNLRFFIREAVQNDAQSDYVIVVQQSDNLKKIELPPLPSNAKYVYHANECYDWGTFGWLLASKHVSYRRYKYLFFMNCSVRGPFLPAYARGRIHWTLPFIRRLTDKVKLVGPTISCEGSPLLGDMQGKWKRNPHVQSYVVATDQEGLQVLVDDGKIFHCHNNRWNTIYYSELGSSHAVLKAGYNIDCFMTRYQGIDWRDHGNWNCNMRYSPQGEHYYDGITLDPLEVMFVKVKSYMLQNEIGFALKAQKYDRWMYDRTPDNTTWISSNEYIEHQPRYKIGKVLVAKARGSSCFDFPYYSENNADLQILHTNQSLWKHFVYYGQFESRPHRFTCAMDFDKLVHPSKPASSPS